MVVIDRGPQIPLDMDDRKIFLRHYVEAFTMWYFYTPGEGESYSRTDVGWWTDICFALLSRRDHQKQISNLCNIIHQLVSPTCPPVLVFGRHSPCGSAPVLGSFAALIVRRGG